MSDNDKDLKEEGTEEETADREKVLSDPDSVLDAFEDDDAAAATEEEDLLKDGFRIDGEEDDPEDVFDSGDYGTSDEW